MLSICLNLDKVPAKILIRAKFIRGEAHILGICNDLMRGENQKSQHTLASPPPRFFSPLPS